MKFVAFCEAPADFRMVSGLVDRMLREIGPAWVVDNLDTPDAVLTWVKNGTQPFFDVHKLNEPAAKLGVRSHGHFDGKPGHAGAAMARKAFRIARALHKRSPDEPIGTVIFVWDTDQDEDRPRGVRDALEEAKRWELFPIAYGLPDPEREAWLLAGFAPRDDDDRRRLAELHTELGFSPVHQAHRLRDKTPGTPRNIKRVLEALGLRDLHRETECWTSPALETLHKHGKDSGLSAFLAELDAALRHILNVK